MLLSIKFIILARVTHISGSSSYILEATTLLKFPILVIKDRCFLWLFVLELYY